MIDKVNLAEKFNMFTEQWSPKLVGSVNDMHVKIARVEGEFIWHTHDNEDEMFIVVEGKLTICLRERNIEVAPGEFIVIPRGVEHKPVSDGETKIMMIEPGTTVNTGGEESDRTVVPSKI